ncbi:MAG: protein kinase, partial [Nitrospirae bacterium]|nr:protein kinase [Fimbriimonadaceae bacterium]
MSSSALKLLQGRVVDGRYLLDEWLGGGSFGGVFLAGEYVDDRRLRTVAVKLLPAEPGDAGDAQRRELEVSLNLDHPNLLRCFSAGRCGVEGFDVLYLTMEVAEGSLEARLQESRLSESETRELALSLASALAHLHAKNLVHRDVKPGNVLRVGDAWKLADFGSVRAVEKSTAQASKNIGTASYAPPEAYEGSVSSAWAVWSLGRLLQEAATGVLPFEADTPTALMHRVLTG